MTLHRMFSDIAELGRLLIDARSHPRQRLPRVIQFPVNDICNSRCQMCLIYKQKLDAEITPDQTRKVLSNRLFRKVRAVGINGGEPTLRKDLPDLTQAMLESLPSLRGVSLITNAINSAQVISAVTEMSVRCADRGVALSVMVSLDGVREIHDTVRGRPGNFQSAEKVINHLQQHVDIALLSAGCTIVRDNAYGLEELLNWCQSKGLYARYRMGVPHQRLYNLEAQGSFALDEARVFHVATFLDYLQYEYETQPARRAFYRSLRNQLVYSLPRTAGCHWKNEGVTLTSRGELAYCAVKSPILGSAIQGDVESLYKSNEVVLSQLVDRDCKSCMHDYDGISDPRLVIETAIASRVRQWESAKQQAASAAQPLLQRTRVLLTHHRLRRIVQPKRLARIRGGKRVLLAGWYGTETLGDKAILAGIALELHRHAGPLDVDVASIEPYVTQQTVRELSEVPFNEVLTLADAKRSVCTGAYDVILIAGGPLMSTIDYVVDLYELLVSGRRVGARTAVCGCGIGPLDRSAMTGVIARLLRVADVVTVRDERSQQLARTRLGYRGTCEVMPDPSMAYLSTLVTKFRRLSRNRSILIALRDWQFNEYGRHLKRQDAIRIRNRYEEEVRRFVQRMHIDHGRDIIPMCMHKRAVGGDDRFFYQRVLSDFPDVVSNLEWRHRAPADDFKQFRTCAAALCMRFHSAVFATAASTPWLAIDYTCGGKVAAFSEYAGAANRCYEIANFDGTAVADRLASKGIQPIRRDSFFNESSLQLASVFEKIIDTSPKRA